MARAGKSNYTATGWGVWGFGGAAVVFFGSAKIAASYRSVVYISLV